MKQMIWSSYDLLDETAKEEYQDSQREILDDDSYEDVYKRQIHGFLMKTFV